MHSKISSILTATGMVVALLSCSPAGRTSYDEAMAFIQEQDYREAIALLDRAVEENANYAAAYVARGTCNLRLKNYEQALADYNRGIDLVGQRGNVLPEVYFNRGEVFQALSMSDSAFSDFTMAISLKPDFALAYCKRGTVLTSMGLNDSARYDFQRALSLDSALSDAYFELGNSFADEDRNQAIQYYSQAISIEQHPYYYCNRGFMYYLQATYDLAIRDFGSALTLDSAMVEAYEMRGSAYDENGMPEAALKDFDRAIALDVSYASAYFNRGITRSKSGDKTGACADFKKALELGYVEALTRTGDCP